MNPFARKKPNPKRKEARRVGNGRVRLRGEELTVLRWQAFQRSGGRCEMSVMTGGIAGAFAMRCNRLITWESMQISHDRHGANRSDTLDSVKASCKECHEVGVHNPKPCPRKPGRVMNVREAQAYWLGTLCLCGQNKKSRESLCPACLLKVSKQIRHDLEHAVGREWRETLAAGETEILRREEK